MDKEKDSTSDMVIIPCRQSYNVTTKSIVFKTWTNLKEVMKSWLEK